MPTSPSISLKIDPASKRELTKIAESKNVSISSLARDILVESLSEDNQLALLKMEVASLCLLYTSPSPRDATLSRMPSSA